MAKKLFTGIIMFLMVVGCSENSAGNSDSLKDHLKVRYYIHGRVKTVEIFKGLPFLVEINPKNFDAIENHIQVKLHSRNEVIVSYDLNNQSVESVLSYDSLYQFPQMTIKFVQTEDFLNLDNSRFKRIQQIDYGVCLELW